MKPNLIIAGASFPFGALEFGTIACEHGFTPMYLEHAKFASLVEDRLPDLLLCDQIPTGLLNQPGMFVPVLESWVSEGAKLTNHDGLAFDHHAAATSRSKAALSAVLLHAGLPSVPRRDVKTKTDALDAATATGYPVILRQDAGYSGRGVRKADSPDELAEVWQSSISNQDSDDIREMRRVLASLESSLVIEPYFEGQEWSIDLVVSESAVMMIRATEKAIRIVEGCPTCIGYRLVSSEETLAELGASAQAWARALFQRTAMSFGCFDVRRNRVGEMVPIDFNARLGGDEVPRLVRAASLGGNPYAAALDATLAIDPSKMQTLRAGASIVHAYAEPDTVFHSISVDRLHRVLNTRQSGFRVGQSRSRRVATLMIQFDSSDEFFDACENQSDWLNLELSLEKSGS
jgi:hypothetical protein